MGRRSNGEGSLQKLKSGNWRGQIMDGYTDEGKRRIINFTAPTRAEVQQKIRQYLAEKEAGLLIRENMAFSQWAEVWYKDYEGQVQPSTHAGYRYTLNGLISHFGDKPLRDIKQIDINRFLAELQQLGRSHSLQSKCKAMLIQIFNAAEANDLVLKNPALHARCAKDLSMSDESSKKAAFTDEEFELLMSDLPDDLLGNSIRTMLVSGLRTQELLALTPEDIEEDGSVLRVNKAVKMVAGKPVLGPPKSKRGKRDIPIPEDFRECVRYIRENGGKAFIWTSPSSETLLYGVGSFRRRYYRALESVPRVRKLTPHCCRHTYITSLQAKGVPLEHIARLVGHSDITTTDGYAHTSIATLAEAVSVLDRHHDKQTADAASTAMDKKEDFKHE